MRDVVLGPGSALNKVAVANTAVVEVAKTLTDYARSLGEGSDTLVLRQQIEKLIDSANSISGAVREIVTKRPSSGGPIA